MQWFNDLKSIRKQLDFNLSAYSLISQSYHFPLFFYLRVFFLIQTTWPTQGQHSRWLKGIYILMSSDSSSHEWNQTAFAVKSKVQWIEWPLTGRKQVLISITNLKDSSRMRHWAFPSVHSPLKLQMLLLQTPICSLLRKLHHFQYVESSLKSEGKAPQCLAVHAN